MPISDLCRILGSVQSVEPKPEHEPERHVPGPSFPFRSPRDGRRDRIGYAGRRVRDRVAIVLVLVVLPVLTIPAAIVMAPSVPGAWSATHGHGVHGTFTSYYQTCNDALTWPSWPHSCELQGDFDRHDGSIPVDATLAVPSETIEADQLPVILPTGRQFDEPSVYIAGSRGWIEPATSELAALALLGAWVVLVVRAWRERRRHRGLLATPGYVDGGRHRRTDG